MRCRAGGVLLPFVLVACAGKSAPAPSQPAPAPAPAASTEPEPKLASPCREATLRTFAADIGAIATEPLADPERARMRVRWPDGGEPEAALARVQKAAEAAGVVVESWTRDAAESSVTMTVTCP